MRVLKHIGVVMMSALAVVFVSTSGASAAPLHMDITDAVMDLGELSGVKAIDSDIPDPPATLTGDVTGSDVTIPKAGFVFPPKSAEVSPGVSAIINMEANEDITGTFETATGDLSLAVSLKAAVEFAGSNCVISPIDLNLSTKNGKPYLGVPYAEGIEGKGALSARWSGLPPVTGGGMCTAIAGLIAGPGGIWMAHGISTPETCADKPSHPGCDGVPDPPAKEPKLTSGPTGSTPETSATFAFEKGDGETQPVTGFDCSLDEGAFEPCDSGTKEYTGLTKGMHTFKVRAKNSEGEGPAASRSWTVEEKVTPPPPGPAKLGALKVGPKNKKVKRGKKVTITTKVRNVGESTATKVRICVTAPKRFIKVKKCVNKGSLAAGKTATAKFKVTVKRKAKRRKTVVLKFKATAKGIGAKSGKAKVKVK